MPFFLGPPCLFEGTTQSSCHSGDLSFKYPCSLGVGVRTALCARELASYRLDQTNTHAGGIFSFLRLQKARITAHLFYNYLPFLANITLQFVFVHFPPEPRVFNYPKTASTAVSEQNSASLFSQLRLGYQLRCKDAVYTHFILAITSTSIPYVS